jgi:hypothetical protein
MRYRVWCAIAILALARAGAARAGECDGVSFPDHITVQGQDLTLNGLGLRKATWFGIKVYVGALYLKHPSRNAAAILNTEEPSEIVLQFVRSVSAGELRGAWRDGFAHSAPGELARLRSRIEQVNGWMKGVKSGERMVFVRIPGQGIRYFLDGTLEGTIKGEDFAKAFLGIWLGPNPPGRRLKAGLLGGKCE